LGARVECRQIEGQEREKRAIKERMRRSFGAAGGNFSTVIRKRDLGGRERGKDVSRMEAAR